MNALQIFENPEFGSIRTVELDGTPWLVGKDVAQALGYVKPENALSAHVDEEDKGVTELVTPGGKQKMTIINESGQAADGQEVPPLGDGRGAAQHPQARGVRRRGLPPAGTDREALDQPCAV